MILDTCFLIDLERRKVEPKEFLSRVASDQLYITTINFGELACGIEEPDLPRLVSQLRHFRTLEVTSEAAMNYSRIFRTLKSSGSLIGTNDLWIASIALANKLPIVTKNTSEFGRVPGLSVIRY